MSTRCQIKVTYLDKEVLIYHHHDGYPEGVGYDLVQRQKKLNTWNGSEIVNDLVKDTKDEYEVAFLVHTDIDYWYEIDCNCHTIRCWRTDGFLLSEYAKVKKGEEQKL